MKIISQFKDYYDFIAHSYGGGDPNLVLNRNLQNKPVYRQIKYGNHEYANQGSVPKSRYHRSYRRWHFG